MLTQPLGHSSGVSDLAPTSERMESSHDPGKGKTPGVIKQARYEYREDVPETKLSTSTDDHDFSDSDGSVSLGL